MTDENIFKSKEDDKPNLDDKPKGGNDEGLDVYLKLLSNEDGSQKYTSVEEALKGGVHAQSHISTLEKELKDLREKDDKDTSMEKILEALKGKPEDKSEDKSEGITTDDIAKVVTQLMDNRETVTTEKQNITTVVDKFKSVYGEKASETMYGKAKDLGLGQSEINLLIASNPAAALKILGMDGEQKKESDGLNLGGVNTDGFQEKSDGEIQSSMGFISGVQLQDNWEQSKAATNKRLGIEIST